MLRRQTVVEKFSTFLDATENKAGHLITHWKLIPALETNMRRQIESCADALIQFWAISWLQSARSDNPDPRAEQHLSAYLQEACFWAAIKTYAQLHTSDMTRLDYLQIAQLAASDPVAIFKKYDDSRGKSLESYGQFQLERAILAKVCKGKEAAGYSDCGLLRALSKKALKVALQKAGIQEPELSRCLLAWHCFNEIYTPTRVKRKLQPPNSEELATFAEHYNQLRFPQYQEPALSGDNIDILLQTCIRAARETTKIPRFIPFNDPEHSDQAPHPEQELPTPNTSQNQAEQAKQEERAEQSAQAQQEAQAQQQEQWQQVRAVLAQALAALPESGQTMLQLCHGLGLKQTDIGRAMSVRQYQVSRNLQSYKRPVLQAVAEWSQTQTQIALSPDKINQLEEPLNQWLNWYFQTSFHKFLQTTLLQELRDEIPLLQRYYGQGLATVKVASELNLDTSVVNQRLATVKQCLQSRLHNWVEDTHNLSSDALNSAVKPIAALVEKWLNNANYSTFEI